MFALSNPPIGVGDPVPWIEMRRLPAGVLNAEQLGGNRIVFLFLGSPFAAPSRLIIESLVARLDALQPMMRKHTIGILPIFADAASGTHPAVQAWAARELAVVDDGFRFHRAFGVYADNTVQIAAFISDRQLVVREILRGGEPGGLVDAIASRLAAPPPRPGEARAPLLVIPGVLGEPECAGLIAEWRSAATVRSGYMVRDGDGKYAEVLDPQRKIRVDHTIPPRSVLHTSLLARLRKRVFLPMRRYFQFEVRGVERLLLARYAAEEAGHFAQHRDHMGDDYHREFGVTINLNSDFSGGELAFPEFEEAHKPAPGSAIIYSGALMHIVRPVTSGARFCLLSFLMGERGLAVLERYEKAHGSEFERRTVAVADRDRALG